VGCDEQDTVTQKRGKMMDPIPEELVDRICAEVAELTPDIGYQESMQVSKEQPEIIAFIAEMTEDLDKEVRELAIFMFIPIYRMFQRAYGKTIEMVSPDEIIKCYEDNEELLKSLGGAHEKFFERIAEVQMSSQPYVIRYVVETLFEAVQGEDPVLLGEEDMGYLFLLMKTVIDALNMKMGLD
jgi:hypothetical protein